eukprot:CAMPEP_0170330224 /NCGR_PEP_ID=MMETSP0116_2-20130129/66043_1 /TAXON_ID=400756 /ORGANISM="Durinskia baltica, Strain CSIRO CS-38" /LENGTH=66 /DNA_ID=CAMNT_0010583389 /DNA_START=58 /DNA_END=255 /DNA_ORIENTATION=-
MAQNFAAMVEAKEALPAVAADAAPGQAKATAGSGDEMTPTTTASDYGELTTDDEAEAAAAGAEGDE